MTSNNPALVACHECDLLQREAPLEPGGVAECARCGAELFRRHPRSLDRTLALTLAAAILFAIGNAYPLMRIDAQGLERSATLLGTGWGLHEHGMTSLALLVVATTIAIPALEMAALLYMLVPLRAGVVPPGLALAFRLQRALDPWSMVEVFMLGALVSFVKLHDIGEVYAGTALHALAFFVLAQAAASGAFVPRELWARVEALRA